VTGKRHREVESWLLKYPGRCGLLVESRREQVMAIASRHHASRVRLFGSAARGEDRPESDIDLLVDFDAASSLFDLIRMSRELEILDAASDIGEAASLAETPGTRTGSGGRRWSASWRSSA
jgi:uncharacterized protein